MKKRIEVIYDKCNIKGHVYSIVLVPRARLALIVYNSSRIINALYLNEIYDYDLKRDRNLIQNSIEADLIRSMIDEQGLILPTDQFYCIELPYQAIYEGVLGR